MGSWWSCIKEKEPVEEPLTTSYREYVNPIGSHRRTLPSQSVRFAPTVRVKTIQTL